MLGRRPKHLGSWRFQCGRGLGGRLGCRCSVQGRLGGQPPLNQERKPLLVLTRDVRDSGSVVSCQKSIKVPKTWTACESRAWRGPTLHDFAGKSAWSCSFLEGGDAMSRSLQWLAFQCAFPNEKFESYSSNLHTPSALSANLSVATTIMGPPANTPTTLHAARCANAPRTGI